MDLIFFMCGTGILLVSGDLLVRAAVDISFKMTISPMIIGLTVIAFGTSAPELLVGIQATWNGFGGLALGNIIGSNIANILLIIGVPALVMNVKGSDAGLRKNYYYMLLATAIFIIFLMIGEIKFWHGIFLILMLIAFIGQAVFANNGSHEALGFTELDTKAKALNSWVVVLYLAVGFLGLPFGAKILVISATSFAETVGVSEEVIGLTVVAVGTSLPELATSLAAAFRREVNLLLGNVIGSNMFNILGIAGAAALISPLQLTDKIETTSLSTLILASIILVPFIIWRQPITRAIGIIFLFMYTSYTLLLF